MADWRFLAADLRTNVLLGELPLTQVSYGEVLNGAGRFTATLALSADQATSSTTRAPGAPLLTAATIPERTVVWLLRNDTVVGGAIVWARTRGKDRPAQLSGAGFWSFFRQRHLRTDIVRTGVDQLVIARDLVVAAQAATGANIGVVVGTETSGVLRDRTYRSYEVKQAGEAVEQLAAVDGGFDFAVEPTAAFGKQLVLSWPRRGRLAGTTGIAFVDGKNLIDYEVTEDGTRGAREFTALGAGDGVDMLISTQTRTDLIDGGFPLTSAVGSFKDVSRQSTLDSHAQAGVDARATTPTFWKVTVDPDDPDGGIGTFIVGDDALIEIGDDDNFPRQAAAAAGYRRFHRIIEWSVNPSSGGGMDLLKLTLGNIT